MTDVTPPAQEAHEAPMDVEKISHTPSSASSDYHMTPINVSDRHTLTELVRTISQRRPASMDRQQSIDKDFSSQHFDVKNDPHLDPGHAHFRLDKWIKMFLADLDENGLKAKRAGILFEKLAVSGSGAALQYQQTVAGMFLAPFEAAKSVFSREKHHKQILHNFNGLLESSELLVVLGRPGSGCSTLLKTLCGEVHGLGIDEDSSITYNGLSQRRMMKEFKGDVVYNGEVDAHFPQLTVGQTLEFAASARTPSYRLHGMSRKEFASQVAKVVMAVLGLSHVYDTKVGNDFIRGVSGGERKRVSIAEMILAAAPLAAWDNSTRGLDSASALKFVQALRTSADLAGSTHAVAIYQASQAIFDLFDAATVLYQGRQIYFGPAKQAKPYFETMGFYCPPRQTAGDFLTSITNPDERQCREGMEGKVPRTPEDFEQYWLASNEFKDLERRIAKHRDEHPADGSKLTEMRQQKQQLQSDHVRPKSNFLISIPMQIKLNTKRAYQRIWNDISSTLTTVLSQIILALIIGSVFYGTPDASAGFFSKGAVLFFAVLLNALIAISEINNLYAQRPIIEKHASYAFYHPATEAIAGIVSDIPIKFTLAVAFNVILYFLAGLRREPSQFFIFFLISYTITFVMSALFRTMGAVTKTVSQAMTLAGVLVLVLVIYTGFVIPVPTMHPWFSWLRFLNPIFFAFEILIANEFHGREFTCSNIVPAYTPLQGDSFICSVAGAVAGQRTVSGDAFIATSYQYYYSHVWRNFGILIAFLFGFMAIYFFATELNSSTNSTAEALVFRKGHAPAALLGNHNDEEAAKEEEVTKEAGDHDGVAAIPPQRDLFTWRDVVYDINVAEGTRRLLDHVSGYVKPGTLTALMGVSGAGKTTLLDVLAQRTTMGVITGDMLVNAKPLDGSFQRKTGYVQQQDLHLETATVRESLRFSAMLRQPKNVTKAEKYNYVEEVIKMLNMEEFAEAVVGVPGQGLNVEQRKLLTIGVELAAKPKLLLFLDEPTSGLDSQSAWAICAFLRKLADAGQAVLCTIHQPSAILFQEFDRLLFLAKGGKTVYFGPIGDNSRTLLEYFESHGARKCDDQENPAEYMLEIVNAGSSGKGQDWHEVWKKSDEVNTVQKELDDLHTQGSQMKVEEHEDANEHAEFAMPLTAQIVAVTHRVFQQYWRLPAYIMAKWALGTVAGLFIGFSFFHSDTSTQGLQNVIFSVFMIATIFSSLVQQIMPLFVTQRSLYEVRERPSKAYSWKAFLLANILVEIPYNIILGILVFACYLYPTTGILTPLQQGTVLLFLIEFFIYAGTFADLCIAALPDETTAAAVVTLIFSLSLTFCGVMQSPTALPGFWIFMYRVSPFTYWIAGIVSTQLHGKPVDCSSTEVSIFNPPQGQTCGQYLQPYLTQAPGTLQNPDSTDACRYCQLSNADQFLAGSNIYYSEHWRNFGLLWVYIGFNIFMVVVLYYTFRVKKWSPAAYMAKLGKLRNKSSDKTPPVADNAEGKALEKVAEPF